MRILEVGCGPGAAARELLRLCPDLVVVGIDRSATAIEQARTMSSEAIASGRLEFRCVSVEDFALEPNEAPFDLAFALRVGALDGRHPKAGELALRRIAAALKPQGRLYIDGGNPLVELPLSKA
jgi:SAM-dependent methyltransferase